jgi:hypothetical protein
MEKILDRDFFFIPPREIEFRATGAVLIRSKISGEKHAAY